MPTRPTSSTGAPTRPTAPAPSWLRQDQQHAQGRGKWNTYEITAKGDQITVMLNGVRTVELRDSRFASGPIALQRAAGVIKFRKVEIRSL